MEVFGIPRSSKIIFKILITIAKSRLILDPFKGCSRERESVGSLLLRNDFRAQRRNERTIYLDTRRWMMAEMHGYYICSPPETLCNPREQQTL